MSGAAAFFDVDGTLVAGNIVRYYADLRTLDMPPARRRAWMAAFALRVPWYLALDALSRGRLQRAVYSNYRGFAAADLEQRARRYFERALRARLFAAAAARVADHHRRGHRVVLVTGSLRPIVAPLAERLAAHEVLASDLETQAGICTGRLLAAPLADVRKAAAVAACIEQHGLDPAACWAYADSLDDVPMLSRVGHAAVVNPGRRLAAVAAARGWDALDWRAA
jgi:HAD superfamily hydrolase (TIGR01490 family)